MENNRSLLLWRQLMQAVFSLKLIFLILIYKISDFLNSHFLYFYLLYYLSRRNNFFLCETSFLKTRFIHEKIEPIILVPQGPWLCFIRCICLVELWSLTFSRLEVHMSSHIRYIAFCETEIVIFSMYWHLEQLHFYRHIR